MEKVISYSGGTLRVEARLIEMEPTTLSGTKKYRYQPKIYMREIESIKKEVQRITPPNTCFYAYIGCISDNYTQCKNYIIDILDNKIDANTIKKIFGMIDFNKIEPTHSYDITNIFIDAININN